MDYKLKAGTLYAAGENALLASIRTVKAIVAGKGEVHLIVSAKFNEVLHQRCEQFVPMIDNAKSAGKAKTFHLNRGNQPAFQRAHHHAIGENGNSKTGDRGIDQRGCTGRFPKGLCREPCRIHDSFKLFAGAAAPLTKKKRLATKFFRA